MKKLFFVVCLLFTMFHINDASAQSFYGTPDGTRFLFTGNGRPYIRFRDYDVRILDPESPLPEYAVVTFAAIEVYGLDEYNNEVPLTAITSNSGSGYWYGFDFMDAPETLPEENPSIVTVVVSMSVQYHDPVNGYTEVAVYYEGDPTTIYGFDADTW